MYCLVTVVHKDMAEHLTRSDCEGVKKCCLSNAVARTADDMLWNGSKESNAVARTADDML